MGRLIAVAFVRYSDKYNDEKPCESMNAPAPAMKPEPHDGSRTHTTMVDLVADKIQEPVARPVDEFLGRFVSWTNKMKSL